MLSMLCEADIRQSISHGCCQLADGHTKGSGLMRILACTLRTEYKSKGKKKKKKSDQTDHYALLGLQQERWTATEAQIKLGVPLSSLYWQSCYACR